MGRAVASSSAETWVHARLEQVELLELFDVVVCAGEGLRPKPEPDVYLSACAALAVAPSRAIAIEDSAYGVAAATAAGMWCVAVPNAMTFDMDLCVAHHHASSLADFGLLDALRLSTSRD
jgi:beta-phosphoglucomutase-like phosphatase (HAD superfamily)